MPSKLRQSERRVPIRSGDAKFVVDDGLTKTVNVTQSRDIRAPRRSCFAPSAPMNRPARLIGCDRDTHTMESLDIQGFTFEQRYGLLADLATGFVNCGGWIRERKTISATNMEIRAEIRLHAALDLYAAIVATGLELTRSGHEALTELCTRRNHMPIAAELGQVVVLRLEISFLKDVTMHSLLSTGVAIA